MPAPAPPRRILVTAFEPFAAPGKPMRPENASETVLLEFLERHRDRCASVVLPVDPRCEVALARALNGDPLGVVAMGETGAAGHWDTNVEEFARDLPVRTAAGAPGLPPDGTPFRASEFAAEVPLLEGMRRRDGIGSWWCNRAYWRVLEWCQLFHRPAVFLHLRVAGDRSRQLRHLEHVVDRMGKR